MILIVSNIYSQNIKFGSKANLLLETGTNFVYSDYENTNPGFSFNLGAEYLPKNRFLFFSGYQLLLGFNNFLIENNNLDLPNSISTKSFSVELNGSFGLFQFDKIRTIAQLGLAYHFFSYSEQEFSLLLNKKNGGSISSPFMQALIEGNYDLNNNIVVYLNIGMNFAINDNLDAISIGSRDDFFYNLSLGVKYNFWSEIDSDGDGILDENDLCVNEAEDLDGFQDEDGCPDLDNDGDGILDENDFCINLKEDLDGYNDEDGCPDLDNDFDGIPDDQDSCPNVAEDFDGYQDRDGCPDDDNDEDGIADFLDNCPDDKETMNNYLDEDGCPDEIPEEEVKRLKELEMLKISSSIPRSFVLHADEVIDEKTFTIKTSAVNELDRIIKLMKNNPKISWRIEGHVEKYENRSEGIEISKKMAKLIEDYLVTKGIISANLESIGLGDSYPISTNSTVFGRMKNRRVTIIKLN